jgi:lipid-binding SYLF domain-containing protein
MLEKLKQLSAKVLSALGKEEKVLQELHEETRATLDRLEARDPGLKQFLKNAHAYAVFPSVGKATAVLGGAFGKGEVFEQGKMIGYAAVAQITIGVQIGGQTFSEIIAFQDKAALNRFKAQRWAFAANASAVLVKGGAAASADYERGAAVFVASEGGMMLEAAIGAQKFFYRPAVLGRVKDAEKAVTKSSSSSSKSKPRARKKSSGQRPSHGRDAAASSRGKTKTKRRHPKPRRPRAGKRASAAR